MMINKFDYYQSLAVAMIEKDKGRDELYEEQEKIHHLDWELPNSLKKLGWVRKEIDTSPSDALRAFARMFSTVQPKIKIMPMGEDPSNKMKVNRMEKAISWFMQSAGRRGTCGLRISCSTSSGRT